MSSINIPIGHVPDNSALLDAAHCDADIRRRWPPERYPALYLPANEYLALRNSTENGCQTQQLMPGEQPASEYDDRLPTIDTSIPAPPKSGIPDDNRSPSPRIITATNLLRFELPEPRTIVKGILVEGLTILASRPKLGKSWLALQVAIAVASGAVALGSIAVEAGPVLYLALEDNRRRLKSRLEKLLHGGQAPSDLYLATDWPRLDKGGDGSLRNWVADHRPRLVVVDTLARVRPSNRRDDRYGADYDDAGKIKAIADDFGLAIVLVHHQRKLVAEDPLDTVSGTLGLVGAADAVLVLKRERGRHDATMFVTGRDIEERELALGWDAQYCHWRVLGSADEYRLSAERSAVMQLIEEHGPMTPTQATKAAKDVGRNTEINAMKQLLWSMSKDGQLVAQDGVYSIGNRGNPTNGGVPHSDAHVLDTVTRVTTVTGDKQVPARRKRSRGRPAKSR